MVPSLEKSRPIRVEKNNIRSGKERVKNLFDVKVVQLMEDLGQNQKYGIGPIGGYVAGCGRVCNWHQNIFKLMIS